MKKDLSLNLDFSELTGKEETQTKIKEFKKTNKKKSQKKQKNNKNEPILLSIPLSNSKFKEIDLRECNNEDFAIWANNLFPNIITTPEDFSKTITRLRVFKYIMQAHTTAFHNIKEDKRYKVH